MKYKILMATMGMEIGGAETHILELSKGLQSKGHQVIVVSNGGVFVEELTKHGIKHYSVPLHNKKPWNMVKSYRQLKRIMEKEKMDIVHAHARIPAFLCGLLHRKNPFNFVTTVHFSFNTSPLLKVFSNWGDRALAVSQDLKEYVVRNYHYQPNKVRVTVNGINADLYKPTQRQQEGQKVYHLLQVTRLEDYTVKTIKGIFNHVDRLLAVKPELVLDIVGGGGEFDSLKSQADSINKRYGRQVVVMHGPQTEVSKFISGCDSFIGVSRSALEAMAMEKPVVLSGDAGFMGLYTEDKTPLARENNFTCRGTKAFNEEDLINETIRMITLSPEEEKKLGKLGRENVLTYYSVDRMVNDALQTYSEACETTRPLNTLVFGYIGFGNNGDEAIFNILKGYLTDNFAHMDLTALSHNPEAIKKQYNIHSVYGFSFGKVLQALKKSQIVIGNGGSLLQDETSTRSLIYYLAIIGIAKFLRKRVVLFANGIGPLHGKMNRKLAKLILNKVDLITLRDAGSKKLLDEIGVKRPPTFVTADAVLTLEPTETDKKKGRDILKHEKVPTNKPIVSVAIRPWEHEEKFGPAVARVCDRLIEKGYTVLFIPMQSTKKIDDKKITNRVRKQMKNKSYMLKGKYNARELLGVFGQAQVCLGMRYHALVFSLINEVPCVGLDYDMKVENYLNLFRLPLTKDLENLDEDFVYRQLIQLLEDKEAQSEKIARVNKEVKSRAHQNTEYLKRYINKWYN